MQYIALHKTQQYQHCTALPITLYTDLHNRTPSPLHNTTPAPAPGFIVPLCFPPVVQWGHWDNGDPPTLHLQRVAQLEILPSVREGGDW